MVIKLIRGALGLFFLAGALAVVAPAEADTGTGITAPAPTAIAAPAAPSHDFAPALSASGQTPSPSGPVDPGTGETKEAKETRVDYAPYVIGAVVLIVLVASFFFWRKRRISHPSKPG